MPDSRLDGAVITVDGRALTAELHARLVQLRVEESVQLPDAFELRFEDAYFKLFDEAIFAVGTKIEIGMRADGDPTVITSGEVTALSVEPGRSTGSGGPGRHELVVSGFDLTHRLAQAPRRRTFQSMSDADIAGQIGAEYSLQVDADATGPRHDYVMQSNETDLAFLRRRAARTGHDLWVTGSTLHLKRRPSAQATPPNLRWGDNLLHFSVRFTAADRADEVLVRGWDPMGKQAIIGRATDTELITDALAAMQSDSSAQRSFGSIQRSATTLVVRDQAEADQVADSLLSRASGEGVVLRGDAKGDPQIGAGADLKIDGAGSRLSGRYRATSVTHLYGSGHPYQTRFVCSGPESAGLADLIGGRAAEPFRPEMLGLMVGEVTNTDDPEGLCRVKVRLPSFSTEEESAWARVASPGAGPRRGMQWMPEVNDEVLVGFEHGDPTRPMVLGGLWNRSDLPPEPGAVDGGRTNTRLLTSRDGHRLALTDDPTATAELSVSGTAAKLILTQDSSELTGDTELTISAKKIVISATESLTLSGPRVEISADTALTLKGQPIKLN
ncbi:MAG: VgrG-related protein [Propionibacteriaceae bacterium]